METLEFLRNNEPFNLERLKALLEGLDNASTGSNINRDFVDSRRITNNKIVIAGFITCLSGGMVNAAQTSRIQSTDNTIVFFENPTGDNYESYIKELDELSVISISRSKEDILREILSFKILKNNWDGYGAYPAEVLATVKSILLLEKLTLKDLEKISDLFPNPHGTISLIWKNNSGERISLEIGNELMSYYVKYNGQEVIFQDNLEINNTNAQVLSTYIQSI